MVFSARVSVSVFAVAVSAYCLATVGLGKDLHRSKRDSLYDNIYSAISDFSSGGAESNNNNNNGKTLEQLSKELPEQVRQVRQSNFNNGGFQQQLPRAGKTSMIETSNINKDCDDKSDIGEHWRRKRKKRKMMSVEEADGGFFLKLFMPFLIGQKDASVVKRRKTVSFSNRRSSNSEVNNTPAGTPIQRNVVNPSNPFLRSPKKTTKLPPPIITTPKPTLGFTPSQTLMSHPAIRVTTPAPSFTSSFPSLLSSPRPSSSPLKSFSASPSLSINNNPVTTILPPVTAFSHIFQAVPSGTPRPRPRQPRPPKPSFSPNRRPTPPSNNHHPIFTNFAFFDDYEYKDYDYDYVKNNDIVSIGNSGPQVVNQFSSSFIPPKSASLRVRPPQPPPNTLGRQRQVVVDGFPAGLPAGTPQGVIIALASMVETGEMPPIPGEAGVDYPTLSSVPETGFDCGGQQWLPGIYSDTGADCQVFYMCQLDGNFNAFLCPNGTVFNQQYFICDWWYNVDCSASNSFYALNEFLYQDQPDGFSNNNGFNNNNNFNNNGDNFVGNGFNGDNGLNNVVIANRPGNNNNRGNNNFNNNRVNNNNGKRGNGKRGNNNRGNNRNRNNFGNRNNNNNGGGGNSLATYGRGNAVSAPDGYGVALASPQG